MKKSERWEIELVSVMEIIKEVEEPEMIVRVVARYP